MSSITSPWSIFGAPQITSLMAALNFRRTPGTPYSTPVAVVTKLAELEASAADELRLHPAIAKFSALKVRREQAQATLAAARQEVAEAEKAFSADIAEPPAEHDFCGDELLPLRENAAERERLLAMIEQAYQSARVDADQAVTETNNALRLAKTAYLKEQIEPAEKELFAMLCEHLEKTGALHSALKGAMFASPLNLSDVMPPAEPTAEPELAAAAG